MKYIKIITINTSILFFLLILIELVLGGWFKNNNFGYSIRELRNIKIPISVKYENKKYNYFFKRNNLGFIGEELKAQNIKVLFLGGSTGEEMFKPPQFRIVNQLNAKFLEDSIDINIINASKGGKSTRGYVNDFIYWFPKINNFNPKIIIFYTGINDSSLALPDYFDLIEKKTSIEKFEDYFKNNSFFYSLKKKIQNKYFNKLRKYYGLVKDDLYENFNFIDFEKANTLFTNIELNDENKNVINNFSINLRNLNKVIIEKKIVPIFITQVKFDGISDHNLYLVNNYLKKFCLQNNYEIIKLDEIIKNLDKKDFYDHVHTTIKGSTKISNLIYYRLKKILENKISF